MDASNKATELQRNQRHIISIFVNTDYYSLNQDRGHHFGMECQVKNVFIITVPIVNSKWSGARLHGPI